jgi:hypothetical protein
VEFDVEAVNQNNMMVGLSSWIIADGNYSHFKRGERASFALQFYPTNSPLGIPRDWLSVNPPGVDRASISYVEGSDYLIAARVTHVFDHNEGWWVIDAGIPMYRYGKPPDGIESGCWISGKVYVGIDEFFYFETLSKYDAAPALIYDWEVTKIELETTPIIESGRVRMRDQSRRGWREVDDTKAKSGAVCDEFVLHCARGDAPPGAKRA